MKSDRKLTPEEFALVEQNAGLAQFLYHRYKASFTQKADYGVDTNELLSQAYYGLIRAAMRYRAYGEEKGYSEESIVTGQYFSVFARKSIIGQMLDYLRKLDHVHTLVRKDYKILVEAGLGSADKTDEEVVETSELTPERAQKVIKLVHAKPVYLEDNISGEQTVGEGLAHPGSVESSALESSLRQALVDCIDRMPEKTQAIVYLKYYLGLELPDIAALVEDTLTSVRRIHTEALGDIHDALVSRVLGA